MQYAPCNSKQEMFYVQPPKENFPSSIRSLRFPVLLKKDTPCEPSQKKHDDSSAEMNSYDKSGSTS